MTRAPFLSYCPAQSFFLSSILHKKIDWQLPAIPILLLVNYLSTASASSGHSASILSWAFDSAEASDLVDYTRTAFLVARLRWMRFPWCTCYSWVWTCTVFIINGRKDLGWALLLITKSFVWCSLLLAPTYLYRPLLDSGKLSTLILSNAKNLTSGTGASKPIVDSVLLLKLLPDPRKTGTRRQVTRTEQSSEIQ